MFQLSSVIWCTCGSHLRKFSCESYPGKWLSQETLRCVTCFRLTDVCSVCSVQLAKRVLQLESSNAALNSELNAAKQQLKQLTNQVSTLHTTRDNSRYETRRPAVTNRSLWAHCHVPFCLSTWLRDSQHKLHNPNRERFLMWCLFTVERTSWHFRTLSRLTVVYSWVCTS